MSSNSNEVILLIPSGFDEETLGTYVSEIKVETLKAELLKFRKLLSEILSDQVSELGSFVLEEVSIKVEVNAAGKIAILGSGVSGSATGGITLKFVKAKS